MSVRVARIIGPAISSVLLVASSALAQSPEPSMEPATDAAIVEQTTGQITQESAADSASDFWLLQNPSNFISPVKPLVGDAGLVQIDGTSGEVISVLSAPEAEGCFWQMIAGVTDDALWLLSPVNEFSAVDPEGTERLCIGRVPLDGTDAEIFAGPGVAEVLVVQVSSAGSYGRLAIHDGEPYFIGVRVLRDAAGSDDYSLEDGLYRLDTANESVELVVPSARSVFSSQGKLFVSDASDAETCGVQVLDPGSTQPRALKAVKSKFGCPSALAADGDILAVSQYLDKSKGVIIDTASEKAIGKLNARRLDDLQVADGEIWTRLVKKGRHVPAYVAQGKKTKVKTDKCQACIDPVVAVTPDAVWTLGERSIRRIDPSSREVTLELDLATLAADVAAWAG